MVEVKKVGLSTVAQFTVDQQNSTAGTLYRTLSADHRIQHLSIEIFGSKHNPTDVFETQFCSPCHENAGWGRRSIPHSLYASVIFASGGGNHLALMGEAGAQCRVRDLSAWPVFGVQASKFWRVAAHN